MYLRNWIGGEVMEQAVYCVHKHDRIETYTHKHVQKYKHIYVYTHARAQLFVCTGV